jgi:hypothetical protein
MCLPLVVLYGHLAVLCLRNLNLLRLKLGFAKIPLRNLFVVERTTIFKPQLTQSAASRTRKSISIWLMRLAEEQLLAVAADLDHGATEEETEVVVGIEAVAVDVGFSLLNSKVYI